MHRNWNLRSFDTIVIFVSGKLSPMIPLTRLVGRTPQSSILWPEIRLPVLRVYCNRFGRTFIVAVWQGQEKSVFASEYGKSAETKSIHDPAIPCIRTARLPQILLYLFGKLIEHIVCRRNRTRAQTIHQAIENEVYVGIFDFCPAPSVWIKVCKCDLLW